MLAQVVSRVRLQFRRSKSRHPQPPDLRRFSDFENPFPRVSPGGYTKYYEEHGMPQPKALPAGAPNAPSPTLVISTPKPRVPKSSARSTPTSPSLTSRSPPSSSKSSSSPTSSARRRTRALSTIREGSDSSLTRSPSSPTSGLANTPSLRRRHARLLRTPSVERHFPATAPGMPLLAGGSPAVEDSEFSSNESSQSHSSRTDESLNTPPTSVEEDGPLLFKIEAAPSIDELYDRPESWSSYWTARSHFSDD